MAKFAIHGQYGVNPRLLAALRKHEAFKTYGALSATNERDQMTPGRLPEPHLAMFKSAVARGLIDYTVYSYATPILWVMYDGTVISPDQEYSKTTTKHQRLLRERYRITTYYFSTTWWKDGKMYGERFYTEGEAQSKKLEVIRDRCYGAEVCTMAPVRLKD